MVCVLAEKEKSWREMFLLSQYKKFTASFFLIDIQLFHTVIWLSVYKRLVVTSVYPVGIKIWTHDFRIDRLAYWSIASPWLSAQFFTVRMIYGTELVCIIRHWQAIFKANHILRLPSVKMCLDNQFPQIFCHFNKKVKRPAQF